MSKEDIKMEDLKVGDRVTANFQEWPNCGGMADYIVVVAPKNDNGGKLVKQFKRLDK